MSRNLQPQTDACNTSFGVLFGNLQFCATFDAVNILECFKLLLAIMIWSISLQSQQICSHCENQALIHILNSGTRKFCLIMLLNKYNDANLILIKFKPHCSLLVHIIILLLEHLKLLNVNFNRSPRVSRKAVNPASPYDPTTPINAVKCGHFTIPTIKTDHMVCIGSFFFRC